MTKIDIHDFKRRLYLVKRALQLANIPRADKDLLYEFENQLFADGLGTARIAKYLQSLKALYDLAPWSVRRATRKDITAILAGIERSDWQPWTKHDYKLALRKYLEFAGCGDLARPIRLSPVHTGKLPEELLTTDDIGELLAAARTASDKAFIYTLYESGCRIGELLSLRRRHVTFDCQGAVLIVDGKTGMRRVRVIESPCFLDDHLSFISPIPDARVFPHSYRAYANRLKALAARACIDKRVYPHLFRHSRATYLAGYLTEAQLCLYMGWTLGSNMPRIYVHLAGADLDAALARVPKILCVVQQPSKTSSAAVKNK